MRGRCVRRVNMEQMQVCVLSIRYTRRPSLLAPCCLRICTLNPFASSATRLAQESGIQLATLHKRALRMCHSISMDGPYPRLETVSMDAVDIHGYRHAYGVTGTISMDTQQHSDKCIQAYADPCCSVICVSSNLGRVFSLFHGSCTLHS